MTTKIDRPVASLDIRFEFQTGLWEQLFDLHVEFIQQDILRSLAAERFVVYLSCPISSRGGSISITNVEIADATARRLSKDWGGRLWILNPGQYQLESKQGTGLIQRHARWLKLNTGTPVDIEALMKNTPPSGGDYMRMWTRVLAEDGAANLGERFSAFYFIGPTDYHDFFTQGGGTNLVAGVEEYFARKYATDLDFNTFFSPPFRDEKGNPVPPEKEKQEWESRRREFVRFYTLKAGANFSKGAHDEWNIWVELNKKRMEKFGVGRQIPGYFESLQVPPSAAETPIVPGYAAPNEPSIPEALPTPAMASEATSHELAISSLVNLSAPSFLGATGGNGPSFAADAELTLPGGTLYESFFWGISRHELIAGAAHRLLDTPARNEVERLLSKVDASDLSEVAGWADLIKRAATRPTDPETVSFMDDPRNRQNRPWHYVDIPIGASSYDQYPDFTREDDVVQILSEAIRVLLGRSDRFNEANALRLVTHLVGDIHQPVHVGCCYINTSEDPPQLAKNPAEILANDYKDDQGGNAIWLPVGANGVSLHSYWDSRLGGTINLFSRGATDSAPGAFSADLDKEEIKRFRQSFINKLVRMFPSGKFANSTSSTSLSATAPDQLPLKWANVSLQVAASAYESLAITGQHTDDQGNVKYDVSFEDGRAEYDQRCKPIVRQQMQLAAQNLGALLNKIWP